MSELPKTRELEAALVSDDGAGVEEYDAAVRELLARIAEMEADHAAVAKAYNDRYTELIEARARIAELEAERDALRLWQEFAREQMSDAALREVDRRSRIRGKNP